MRWWISAFLALSVAPDAVAESSQLANALSACVAESVREGRFLETMQGPPREDISLMCKGQSADSLFGAMSGVSHQSVRSPEGVVVRSAASGVFCLGRPEAPSHASCTVRIYTGEAFAAAFVAF